jgi:hypothetical protein
MGEWTPFQCFLLGIASAWTGIGLLVLGLWIIARKAKAELQRRPFGPEREPLRRAPPHHDVFGRLASLEARVAELEAERLGGAPTRRSSMLELEPTPVVADAPTAW